MIFEYLARLAEKVGLILRPRSYNNPVDGKSYIGYWKKHSPTGGVRPQTGRVVNTETVILTEDSVAAQRTTAEDVSAIILTYEDAVRRAAEDFGEGGKLIVQVTMRPDAGLLVHVLHSGDLKEEMLRRMAQNWGQLDIRTKEGTVEFQMHLMVHPR